MSAVKGVNKTKIDSATPEDRLNPGEYDGRKKIMIDSYEASGLVAGSTISMGGAIPKNAIVTAMFLTCDALGAATFDIGDAEDADRYFDGQSVASALYLQKGNEIDGIDYQVDETDADNLDSQVIITTISATINGTIKLQIEYVHD